MLRASLIVIVIAVSVGCTSTAPDHGFVEWTFVVMGIQGEQVG
jgi:hypothetical protein